MSAEDSRKIQDLINAFIQVECMGESSAYQDTQRKLVKDSGLGDLEPVTLFQMKKVFIEYRNSLSKK